MSNPDEHDEHDEHPEPLRGPEIRMPKRVDRPKVLTPAAAEAINTIFDAHQDGGFVCVSGRAGTGKTTMTELLIERLEAWYDPSDDETFTGLRYEVGKVDRRDRAAMKRMCLSVHREVGGDLDEGYLRRAEDKDIAESAVRECKLRGIGTLVLDEAGGLSVDAIRGLMLIGNVARREGHTLQIVLVGMDDLPAKLKLLPQIERRVNAWIFFHRYELKETFAFLRAVHPHFARLDMRKAAHAAQVDFVHRIAGGLPGLMVPFLNQVDRAMRPLGEAGITLALLKVVHQLRSANEISALDASGFGTPGSSGKSRRDSKGKPADKDGKGGKKGNSGKDRRGGGKRRAGPDLIDDAGGATGDNQEPGPDDWSDDGPDDDGQGVAA